MENSPKCLRCIHLITREIGYSEYTITGEEFKCAEGQFEDWDNESLRGTEKDKTWLEKSRDCKKFCEGEPTEFCINCSDDEKCQECQ